MLEAGGPCCCQRTEATCRTIPAYGLPPLPCVRIRSGCFGAAAGTGAAGCAPDRSVLAPAVPQSPELCRSTSGFVPSPREIIRTLWLHTPLPDRVETKE